MAPESSMPRASDALPRLFLGAALLVSALLAACAGLPPALDQAPSAAVIGSSRTDLGARGALRLRRSRSEREADAQGQSPGRHGRADDE